MADPTKRAIAGAPLSIPAAAFNAFTDASVAHKRRRAQATVTGLPDSREGLILVRNDSGHDVPRFGVLGIADILINPSDNLASFQDRPSISGATPAADTTGIFVITAEPIASGKIGKAFVFGVCPVLVNVVAAGDGFADIKNGDRTQLQSNSCSGAAQILWMESLEDTGQMWCLVRLGNAPSGFVWVRPNGTCTKDGTYTAKMRPSPTGTFDSSASGHLAAADFGSDGGDCIVINADEEGQPGHELVTDGTFLPMEFLGTIVNFDIATNLPVVKINGDQYEACS